MIRYGLEFIDVKLKGDHVPFHNADAFIAFWLLEDKRNLNGHEGEKDEEIKKELANVSEGDHDHLDKEAEAFKQPQVEVDLDTEEKQNWALKADYVVFRWIVDKAHNEICQVDEDKEHVNEVPEILDNILDKVFFIDDLLHLMNNVF